VKDLYNEKYEILMKEIKDDTKDGKTFRVLGLEEYC
jgi:DNA-directed RNA polymerase subunit N (RpoN/RPB10)